MKWLLQKFRGRSNKIEPLSRANTLYTVGSLIPKVQASSVSVSNPSRISPSPADSKDSLTDNEIKRVDSHGRAISISKKFLRDVSILKKTRNLAEYLRDKVKFDPAQGILTHEGGKPFHVEEEASKFGVSKNVLRAAGIITNSLILAGMIHSPAGPAVAAIALSVIAVRMGVKVQQEMKFDRLIRESNSLELYLKSKNKSLDTSKKLGLSTFVASKIGLSSLAFIEKKGDKLSEYSLDKINQELLDLNKESKKLKQDIKKCNKIIKDNLEYQKNPSLPEERIIAYKTAVEQANRRKKELLESLKQCKLAIKEKNSIKSSLARDNIISKEESSLLEKTEIDSFLEAAKRNSVTLTAEMVSTGISIAANPVLAVSGLANLTTNFFINSYDIDKEKKERDLLVSAIQLRRSFDDVPGYDDVNEIQKMAFRAKIDSAALKMLEGNDEFKACIDVIESYKDREVSDLVYEKSLITAKSMVEKAKLKTVVAEYFIRKSSLIDRYLKKNESFLLQIYARDSTSAKEKEIESQIREEKPHILSYDLNKKVKKKLRTYLINVM
jgi:hypothetical protein